MSKLAWWGPVPGPRHASLHFQCFSFFSSRSHGISRLALRTLRELKSDQGLKRLKPRTEICISQQNFNDSGSGDTYYTTTRLDARLSYLALEKINFTLGGSLQNADYETSTREDDRWLVSLGADYLINDTFSVGFEGGKEERDSNAVGKDFENDYVMFNIKYRPIFGAK